MKTIKTIAAAMVLAMFAGNANADIKITKEKVEQFASLAEYEEPFKIEDIQCSLIAEMQLKGATWALEEANEGRDVRKNIRRLGLRAAVDFPDEEMETEFMQRRDVMKAVYKGAYIMIAYNAATFKAKGEDATKFGDLVNDDEARRKFYDDEFYTCMMCKDKYPGDFYHYYAAGRLAEGYRSYPYSR